MLQAHNKLLKSALDSFEIEKQVFKPSGQLSILEFRQVV
jgi:hypothetical protein